MKAALATGFGIGHVKPSGTWASAAAVVLAVALSELGLGLVVPVLALLATVIGFIVVPGYIAARGDSDPSEVVIDEFAGQWLAISFTIIPLWNHGVSILAAWPAWLVPFALFRLFDIWKPWLVGRADRRGDAAGVMLDDLWAGLFAGLGSMLLAGLYHAVLEPWLM